MEITEYEKMYQFEEKYWWWVGRRELVKGILNKLNPNCALILDVGCGTGINLKHLDDYGAVIGLDLSKDALNFCKMRGSKNIVQADGERLPFKDDTFDLITALDLLEHLNDNKALAGFHRVLKPNGSLVLTVPAFSFMWSKHDEAVHHKRRYSKGQLRSILESNRFRIEKMCYWNFFLFLPIVAMRLIRRSMKNQETKTDVEELPSILNKFLAYLLTIESHLIPHVNVPIGISVVCVARAI